MKTVKSPDKEISTGQEHMHAHISMAARNAERRISAKYCASGLTG